MAIASHKPTTTLPTVPNTPKIEPSNYKSVIYDDNNQPLHSLIAYVAGAPMSVVYYKQLVAEHNDLREVDPGQAGVYQQYEKIIDLEIRVNTPLTASYDADTGITTVTGDALLYPFMVPNVADYFVTDTANNEKAIFRIRQIDRKTFNRDSTYSIEYELVGYVSTLTNVYNDLETKSVRTYHFSRDRLLEGLAPTLNSDDYNKVRNLQSLYKDIVTFYYKTFYDKRYGTLVLPGQDFAIYDSFLVNYLLKLNDTFDAYEIRSIKQIPTDNDKYLSQCQFWDLMYNRDYNSRTLCNDEMGLVTKSVFNKNSYIQGLAYSNMDYVIYPIEPDTSSNIGEVDDIKVISLEEIIETTRFKSGLASAIDNQYVTATKNYSIIHDVLVDSKYVLSENFYSNTVDQSVLEILVKDYMQGKTIDLDMLQALCTNYRSWKRLEQFYYGPIIMTLAKEADRVKYS